MKKTLILFIGLVLFLPSLSFAQSIDKALESLSKEYNFTYETLDKGDVYNERYLLWFEQELAPKNPDSKTFKQRVFISHRDVKKPVVFVTEGYWASYAEYPNYSNQISDILDANQIVVEHRFFPPSVPDSSVFDWKYLTIENAAMDHHRIIEVLKHIYKEKWLSTGISKGGQTAIYHKYFYPNDVAVSVPIVAPINFSTKEQRVFNFLKTVGTDDCRKKIKDFQIDLLKNKKEYLPIFKELAELNHQTYNKVGGVSKAYELTVFEYSFAFWQWGSSCDIIPDTKVTAKEKITNLDKISGINWISDQGIATQQPFFYQTMSEFGMYAYDISDFKPWVSYDENPQFTFTFPEGVDVVFKPEVHQKVDYFVRHEAKNMIFVVGEYDPWSSSSVDLTYSTNSLKFTKPGGSHTTRILNLPKQDKELLIKTLKDWMK